MEEAELDDSSGESTSAHSQPGGDDVKVVQRVVALLLIVICGCSTGSTPDGSEAAARDYFDAEFRKWIGGQETEVSTMMSQISGFKNPISYDVRSVVPDKPDALAIVADGRKFDEVQPEKEGWTAWKFNVAIEWESQAGTPLTRISTYTLTWHPKEKKWLVRERF